MSAAGNIDKSAVDDDFFCVICGRADREVLTACTYYSEAAAPVVYVLCADCIARLRAGGKVRMAFVDMSAWGNA